MQVITIPVLSDNFAYLLVNTLLKTACAVDPVDAPKIHALAKSMNLKIESILTTHHHADHSGGNFDFKKLLPNLKIYGADDRIPSLTHNTKLPFKACGFDIIPIPTPCHTTGHVCYYVEFNGERVVFTGDTLFSVGCGRFFEGAAGQMYDALINKLSLLDDSTRVYFGHEYTLKNIEFALSVDGSNQHLLDYAKKVDSKSQTTPSTIGLEKMVNPFMRVNESSMQSSLRVKDGVEAMKLLREMKDQL